MSRGITLSTWEEFETTPKPTIVF